MPRDAERLNPKASHGIAAPVSSRLICHGCGYAAPLDDIQPYRCRGDSSDNVDHVLRRTFDVGAFEAWSDAGSIFEDLEPNPFRKFRRLFYSYEIAKLGGITDSAFVRIVDRLDAAIAGVAGTGFRATPFTQSAELAGAAGLEPHQLWIKDETGNVSGSHKARHLMGIMIWLEVVRALRRPEGSAPKLAIASCGNAALAAAEVARAAGRPLTVFVPPSAKAAVLSRLSQLGAELVTCRRRPEDPAGDPSYLRFLEALSEGALPFTVQAKRNGITLEGGCTLAWELASSLRSSATELDHLVIQVGGGALAAATIQGLREAHSLGILKRLPRIHTVQTASAFPLRRAYDLVSNRLVQSDSPPGSDSGVQFDVANDDELALKIRDQVPRETLTEELRYAARHKQEFMWPWEQEPRSVAYGILDDETYDWLAVTEGMFETGGIPIVASEQRIVEAHRMAGEHTTVPVEATGSAGLAGLLDLCEAGVIRPGDRAAVLFTGVER